LTYWETLFADVDCCLETVADLAELPDHPHIAARGQVKVTDGPEPLVESLLGLRIDGAPPRDRAPLAHGDAATALTRWRK
jgi:alpha-methylacyl-CoA racemase